MENSDKLRLLCHIGVPKSATTSMQFGAFPTHPDIRFIGKPFYDADFGYDGSWIAAQLIDSFWKQDELDFDYKYAVLRFEKGILPRMSQNKLTVISEEGLTQARTTDRSLVAKRMSAVFEPLDVKILITIREQKSALFSLYTWYFTRRMISGSFDQWLRNCRRYSTYYGSRLDFMVREYQYARLLELYGLYFGIENVLVLPIEMLARTPEQFYRKVEDFSGIRHFWSTTACPEFPKENRSPGKIGISYQRLIKGLQYAWDEYKGKEPVLSEALLQQPVHLKAMKWISRFDFSLRPMSKNSAAWIDDFYREDNLRLSNLTGLDLKGFGYSL
jgi:hypothetical protein